MARPEPEALARAAGAALARRDLAAAQVLALQLLSHRPLDPNANQILGLIALEQGDPAAARNYLERANDVAPNQPPILNSLGAALRRLGETDAARAAFKRAGEGGLIDGWRNLGNVEEMERRSDESIAAYQRALKLAPTDPGSHAALAQAFERRHDLARAKAHAEKALSGDPGNEIARLVLGHLLLRERDFVGVEEVAAPLVQAPLGHASLGQKPSGSQTNISLAWGLIGEARDRRGDARGAFAAFTASNRILLEQHRALLGASHLLYHPDGVRRMTALVDAADVTSWGAPPADAAPVFLVGFPRSGTTLLDQILSSHSRIICVEEREHFANALAGVITDAARLAAVAALSDGEIEAVRRDYWRRLSVDIPVTEGALVVDKLPLNIVVLPLIRRVFPDAKIIFALRDPRDVILSCYQQRFGMNAAMAQFLELESAAAYYDAIMRLMQVCLDRLGLELHQVRYEELVADLEAAARRLSRFLGVDFEPSMLNFRATALGRTIATPSARQVIEPLYNRSVGRWRRYAEDLAPVLPRLQPWVELYGYA